jgi:hypothetical protein
MNKKVVLVLLLTFACLSTAYLLISTPATTPMRITSQEHLDELIQQGLQEQGIANNHYRVYTAVQDSFLPVKCIKLTPLQDFQRQPCTMNYTGCWQIMEFNYLEKSSSLNKMYTCMLPQMVPYTAPYESEPILI